MPLFDYAVYFENAKGRGNVTLEGRVVVEDVWTARKLAEKQYRALCGGGEAAADVRIAVREFGGEVRPAARVEEKREDES